MSNRKDRGDYALHWYGPERDDGKPRGTLCGRPGETFAGYGKPDKVTCKPCLKRMHPKKESKRVYITKPPPPASIVKRRNASEVATFIHDCIERLTRPNWIERVELVDGDDALLLYTEGRIFEVRIH